MSAVTPAISKLNFHTRATFVGPKVKTISLTEKVIQAVMPYYPSKCKVIAGYLDDSDQFWKVNYHWDLLVAKIDDFLKLTAPSEQLKTATRAVRNRLMSNMPSPARGYRNDSSVGLTKDQSTPEKIIARHGILKQSKRDFESIIVKTTVVDARRKLSPLAAEKPWWLAVAPVAVPGKSMHGTGYALDIAGDNVATTKVSKDLGASLVFNEASHVHVEFKSVTGVP